MKSFAELRMLMYSIVSCIKSLVWVIAVLVLNMGLFAVLFTSATGNSAVRVVAAVVYVWGSQVVRIMRILGHIPSKMCTDHGAWMRMGPTQMSW